MTEIGGLRLTRKYGSTPSTSNVNQPSAVAAACILFALGGIVYNTLPIFLGSAADGLNLTHLQIGILGSSYMVGFAGIPITTPLWIRRVNWRRVQLAGSAITVISMALMSQIDAFLIQVIVLWIAGAGGGVLMCVSLVSLGDTRNRERLFALSQTSAVLLAAFGVWFLPTLVIPLFGFQGVLLVISSITILLSFLIIWFPTHNEDFASVMTEHRSQPVNVAVFVALLAVLFYNIGIVGLWSFLERIGKDAGQEAVWIGATFSIEKIFALVMCLVGVWQGKRIGQAWPVTFGFLGILLSVILLNNGAVSIAYALGVILFGGSWAYGYPFQTAIVSRADHSGRYTGAIPAAMGIGASIGPGLAGALTEGQTYIYVFIAMTVCMAIGLALFLFAASKNNTPSENQHLPKQTRAALQ